jgi:SLT domain-containing protein
MMMVGEINYTSVGEYGSEEWVINSGERQKNIIKAMLQSPTNSSIKVQSIASGKKFQSPDKASDFHHSE